MMRLKDKIFSDKIKDITKSNVKFMQYDSIFRVRLVNKHDFYFDITKFDQ